MIQRPFFNRYSSGVPGAFSSGKLGSLGRSDSGGVETTIDPPDYQTNQALLQQGGLAGTGAVAPRPQLDAYGRAIKPIDPRSPQEQNRAGGQNLLSGAARATRLGAQVQSNIDAAMLTDEYKLAAAGGMSAPNFGSSSGINVATDRDGNRIAPHIGSTDKERDGNVPGYTPGYGQQSEENDEDPSLTTEWKWRDGFRPRFNSYR